MGGAGEGGSPSKGRVSCSGHGMHSLAKAALEGAVRMKAFVLGAQGEIIKCFISCLRDISNMVPPILREASPGFSEGLCKIFGPQQRGFPHACTAS